MKIFYDINISKLKQEILAVAKFQKVVILLDEYSNLEVVDKLEKEIKKETVCYKIDDVSAVNLIEFLNDGTRCVISFLSDKTFFRVFNELGESLNIFILKYNGLIAPYLSIKNANSMMFVDKNYKIEECEILIFSNALIEQTWNNILHYQNYKKIEFNEFFEIFRESDKNTKDLINFYSKNKWVIKNIDKFECCFFDLNDFEIYLYIRLVS
ncbi:MAG: hypothetical protein IJX26_04730, partial [Clostridia bacterium]|nr:hypothetical protein [Clostridia bacterium]